MGQNAAKKIEFRSKGTRRRYKVVVLRETKHGKTSVHFILCFSGQAKLTEALRGFYAEAQLENVSSLIIIIHFVFRDIAALFNYTYTV